MLASLLLITVPFNAFASASWAFRFESHRGATASYVYSGQLQGMDLHKTIAKIRHNVVGKGANADLMNLIGIYKGGESVPS